MAELTAKLIFNEMEYSVTPQIVTTIKDILAPYSELATPEPQIETKELKKKGKLIEQLKVDLKKTNNSLTELKGKYEKDIEDNTIEIISLKAEIESLKAGSN